MDSPRTGDKRKGAAPTSKAEQRKESELLILEAAEEEFANRGFKGATINNIAKRAGLPKANVLYYFPSKLDLYRRVIDDVFNMWLQAADQFADYEQPRVALTRYLHAKMDLSRTRPNGSKVWANEIMHGAPIIHDYLETRLRDWTATRTAWIQQWIDDGKIRPVNPKYLLYLIWASTQHYADFGAQIEALNGGRPLSDKEFEEAKRSLTDIVLNGLLTD